MQSFLKKFFQPAFTRLNEDKPEMAIDLATAVLMIEVSKADFDADESEAVLIRKLLLSHLSLSEQDIDALLENALEEAEQLVSLQHITRLMNEQLDQQGKVRVIELMWLVAYADGVKHHYEEHLLRKVADLLYLSQEDYIKARHQAENNANAG